MGAVFIMRKEDVLLLRKIRARNLGVGLFSWESECCRY